ncbi:MAG: hypothetical protein C4B57_12165 [Deltaproteobacteria bacterium]|nr:MAG: hypothetical protein C4B57_12165 [Deltaproteobacteria bacterium]
MLCYRSKILYVFVLISVMLCLSARLISAGTGIIDMHEDRALVRVHDHVITLQELVSFAKRAPNFNSYLQVPGGPEKILEEMIWRRLLVLEGHDRGIPEPTEEEGGMEVYIHRVLKGLLPGLPPLTEADARRFYEDHPEVFSTPLMLRVFQIKVLIKNGDEASALARIESARQALNEGMAFGDVARRYSDDSFSRDRGGELGFIPMEKIDPPELEQTLRALTVGRISDIVRVGRSFVIYFVKDRREPVLDPYEQVADVAWKKAEQDRRASAQARLRRKLENKWGVKYLDPEWMSKNTEKGP